jgi:hypothetical protein
VDELLAAYVVEGEQPPESRRLGLWWCAKILNLFTEHSTPYGVPYAGDTTHACKRRWHRGISYVSPTSVLLFFDLDDEVNQVNMLHHVARFLCFLVFICLLYLPFISTLVSLCLL